MSQNNRDPRKCLTGKINMRQVSEWTISEQNKISQQNVMVR